MKNPYLDKTYLTKLPTSYFYHNLCAPGAFFGFCPTGPCPNGFWPGLEGDFGFPETLLSPFPAGLVVVPGTFNAKFANSSYLGKLETFD